MKKLICLLLALLVLSSCAAFAEGKIGIRRQSLFIDPNGNSNYFFAELENTGDEPVNVGRGTLTIQDSKGAELVNKNVYVMGMNPELKPGETMFVHEYLFDKLSEMDVASFDCSFEAATWGQAYTRVPCEAAYDSENPDDNYIYVTVTNDTENTIYGYYVTAAINSTEGRLIFTGQAISTDIGINPHNTVTARIMLSSSLVKFWRENGIEIADIQAELMYN